MKVSKKTLREEKVNTDVLVVGAGAGGLMAAIGSAGSGAAVVLCEKGNARRSGGITGGNDHFRCYIPGIHSKAFRSHFIREITNRHLADEDRVAQYVDRTYEVLQMWESWGIDMRYNSAYEFAGHSWPGTSGKPGQTDRFSVHFSDENQCVKLEKQAQKNGVRIMNRVMITELLKGTNGRIMGAIGISTREPILYIFEAKSIIINKGGVGRTRLYSYSNVMGYSMADPGTGDGVIAAYKVGADVQNAEFFKRQISLRFGPISGKGSWIGVVRDSEGRTIAPPHLARPDRELGDKSIENVDAIDHTWSTGRGPVWMDSRGISEEDEQYMRWGFKSEALLPFLRWLDREKIDVKKTRFEFFGMQPTSNIQARVDKDYRTSIHGLYAIPPGDLSESAVGGFIAGESAAADMKDIKNTDSKNQRSKISKAKACYEEILNREGGQFADWREAQWAVWQTMHCYALPPQRTENTLMAGYHHLLRVRDLAKKTLKASNPHDLYHCLEVLNLMDVAELVLIAVKERRESRGQASRQDYPFTNPLLNKFLVINKRDDCPAIRWEKPRQIS